jgi:hypothetical protein
MQAAPKQFGRCSHGKGRPGLGTRSRKPVGDRNGQCGKLPGWQRHMGLLWERRRRCIHDSRRQPDHLGARGSGIHRKPVGAEAHGRPVQLETESYLSRIARAWPSHGYAGTVSAGLSEHDQRIEFESLDLRGFRGRRHTATGGTGSDSGGELPGGCGVGDHHIYDRISAQRGIRAGKRNRRDQRGAG